jgi:hypothetical protein
MDDAAVAADNGVMDPAIAGAVAGAIAGAVTSVALSKGIPALAGLWRARQVRVEVWCLGDPHGDRNKWFVRVKNLSGRAIRVTHVVLFPEGSDPQWPDYEHGWAYSPVEVHAVIPSDDEQDFRVPNGVEPEDYAADRRIVGYARLPMRLFKSKPGTWRDVVRMDR